jgi:hypothetical protein
MRNRVLAAAALIAAVTAAACDGGSATAPGDTQLTQAQALSLSRAVMSVGTGLAGGGVPSGARGARIDAASGSNTFSFTFDQSAPCPQGGTVAVAGTIGGSFDAQASAAQVQAAVAVRHQTCRVKTEDGATFTLNGDPRIDVGLSAVSGATGLTGLHLTENGAFTWSRGSSSGRCTVDLAADLVAGTQDVRLSGTFCGFPVDGVVQHAGS